MDYKKENKYLNRNFGNFENVQNNIIEQQNVEINPFVGNLFFENAIKQNESLKESTNENEIQSDFEIVEKKDIKADPEELKSDDFVVVSLEDIPVQEKVNALKKIPTPKEMENRIGGITKSKELDAAVKKGKLIEDLEDLKGTKSMEFGEKKLYYIAQIVGLAGMLDKQTNSDENGTWLKLKQTANYIIVNSEKMKEEDLVDAFAQLRNHANDYYEGHRGHRWTQSGKDRKALAEYMMMVSDKFILQMPLKLREKATDYITGKTKIETGWSEGTVKNSYVNKIGRGSQKTDEFLKQLDKKRMEVSTEQQAEKKNANRNEKAKEKKEWDGKFYTVRKIVTDGYVEFCKIRNAPFDASDENLRIAFFKFVNGWKGATADVLTEEMLPSLEKAILDYREAHGEALNGLKESSLLRLQDTLSEYSFKNSASEIIVAEHASIETIAKNYRFDENGIIWDQNSKEGQKFDDYVKDHVFAKVLSNEDEKKLDRLGRTDYEETTDLLAEYMNIKKKDIGQLGVLDLFNVVSVFSKVNLEILSDVDKDLFRNVNSLNSEIVKVKKSILYRPEADIEANKKRLVAISKTYENISDAVRMIRVKAFDAKFETKEKGKYNDEQAKTVSDILDYLITHDFAYKINNYLQDGKKDAVSIDKKKKLSKSIKAKYVVAQNNKLGFSYDGLDENDKITIERIIEDTFENDYLDYYSRQMVIKSDIRYNIEGGNDEKADALRNKDKKLLFWETDNKQYEEVNRILRELSIIEDKFAQKANGNDITDANYEKVMREIITERVKQYRTKYFKDKSRPEVEYKNSFSNQDYWKMLLGTQQYVKPEKVLNQLQDSGMLDVIFRGIKEKYIRLRDDINDKYKPADALTSDKKVVKTSEESEESEPQSASEVYISDIGIKTSKSKDDDKKTKSPLEKALDKEKEEMTKEVSSIEEKYFSFLNDESRKKIKSAYSVDINRIFGYLK